MFGQFKKILMGACFHGAYVFARKTESEQPIRQLLIKMMTNTTKAKCRSKSLKEGLLEKLPCELSFEGWVRIHLVQREAPGIGQSISDGP